MFAAEFEMQALVHEQPEVVLSGIPDLNPDLCPDSPMMVSLLEYLASVGANTMARNSSGLTVLEKAEGKGRRFLGAEMRLQSRLDRPW